MAAGGSKCRYRRRVAYRPRSFYPGVPTHVTARAVDESALFRTDFDRYALLALLRKVTEEIGWHVVCWCLMTTHYHLLVVVPQEADRVSWALQKLHSVYAREFNARYGRRGHVFGERFSDTLIESDPHGRNTIAYILDNPVRAGIVQRFGEWNWSGLHVLRPRDELGTLTTRSRDIPVRRAG
jgi:REP element-mobilizing transposase RayT